jgi:hypothetical protein
MNQHELAHHKAAHALVALNFGTWKASCTIIPRPGFRGRADLTVLPSNPSLAIAAHIAGPIAGGRVAGLDLAASIATCGGTDLAHINKLLREKYGANFTYTDENMTLQKCLLSSTEAGPFPTNKRFRKAINLAFKSVLETQPMLTTAELAYALSTPRMRQNPVYKNIDPIIRKIDREETSSRITQLRHLANASRNQLLANGRADLLCRVDNCSSLPGIQPGHIEQLANELETAVHGFRNARDLRRMGLWS